MSVGATPVPVAGTAGPLLTLTFVSASGKTPPVLAVSGNVLGSQHFFGDRWDDEWPLTGLSGWALLPDLARAGHTPTGFDESRGSLVLYSPSGRVAYSERISCYSAADLEYWTRGLDIGHLDIWPDSFYELVGVQGAFSYHEFSARASDYRPAERGSGRWTTLTADGTLTLVEYSYREETAADEP